ncbi:MAG: T9SS type A sorting domain-containing protein [Flavobacteriaceae bacterium]|nr:T9SS type A sorting domain-containing protein [Flavobacteriaceae bacterium]
MRDTYFLRVSLGFVFLFSSLVIQSQKLWVKSTEQHSYKIQNSKLKSIPKNKLNYKLDVNNLRKKLAEVDSFRSKTSKNKSAKIEFPNSNGEMEFFMVKEASVFEPELQNRFPTIRSYVGVSETATIRFSISNQKGLSLTYTSGKHFGFIERDFDNNYIVYNRSNDKSTRNKFECLTVDDISNLKTNSAKTTNQKTADDGVLRTYRLALSVTAEYTEYHFGGTVGSGEEAAAKASALAAMNATITRVNGIYERDFAVHLSLIAGVDDLIYTNPTTDPYSDYKNRKNWNAELQNNLTSVVGNPGYDVGHLFGHAGGGGDAGCIGCVCQDNLKGSGYTSPVDAIPEGDRFDLDYVSHELGHQFGANHTWTTTENGPGNEGTGANLEPGSGSTIMGYAGITTSNVQSHGDDYFHFKNIEQVTNFVKTTTCDTETILTQNLPVSNAGADYTIPHSTAFILTGNGNSDGNTTYCWEQNDIGGNGGVETSNPSGTNRTGPMFRSYTPSISPVRYMPKIESVLKGNLFSTWESVASISRDLNFKLTVRDNVVGGGQNAIDEMAVTVDGNSGPFVVTSQNTKNIIWTSGTLETITWDVAGTNSAPINTSNVKISLSIDDGETYTELIASTPNDGSQEIRVPNTAAPFCRLMIQAVDNIYFAVNTTTFAIGYYVKTTETCTVYTSTNSLAIPDSIGEDYPGPLISDTVNVTGIGEITDVNITVDITHAYSNDLLLQIEHPDGTKITLFNRDCSDEQGIQIQFDDDGGLIVCPGDPNEIDGTYRSSDELSIFNNKNPNGNWRLHLTDYYAGDIGRLNSWKIEVCSKIVVTIPIGDLPPGELFIYPNPTSEYVNISLNSDNNEDMYISLFDMEGKLILQEKKTFTPNIINTTFYFGSISQGIYVLHITQGAESISNKLIVK